MQCNNFFTPVQLEIQLLDHLIVTKTGYFSFTDIGADVCLKIDKSGINDNKICEKKLPVPGNDPFAMKQSPTFEKAIDALRRQLMDRKREYH